MSGRHYGRIAVLLLLGAFWYVVYRAVAAAHPLTRLWP